MIITSVSHLDHNLTVAHVKYILELFKDKNEFFMVTLELPSHLTSLVSNLVGPAAGDAEVTENEVFYMTRGGRPGKSRMINRPGRATRHISVIAGPHNGNACVLYTAFGGPIAPREPWDSSMNEEEVKNSRDFWSRHALAAND